MPWAGQALYVPSVSCMPPQVECLRSEDQTLSDKAGPRRLSGTGRGAFFGGRLPIFADSHRP